MDTNEMDFRIQVLGEPVVSSPLELSRESDDYIADYVDDNKRVLLEIAVDAGTASKDVSENVLVERAGARDKIYFEPSRVHASVITCGGLCPGLNDVIRAIVMCLWYRYGVRRISGIRYGYRGLLEEFNLPVLPLSPKNVSEIHSRGGTILGSSRGYGERVEDMVDALERMGVNVLFTIGGDGTQKGALGLSKEIKRRGLKIGVVGVPKTIDNDLSFVQRSFGFETAVSKAVDAVSAAHTEAIGAINGIGLVQVMGRQSGFIAAHTALAINDVNFVLVPEVPFDLEGDNGLLHHLEDRLNRRGHAVILAAEGAGEGLMGEGGEKDASGNVKMGDVGFFLKRRIAKYFREREAETNLKYIDPSYIIRSEPANPNDSIYCARLGTNAVHAAMAGKTEMLISLLHNHLVHIPIQMAVSKRNRIDPDGPLWRDVIDATGQPALMKNSSGG